jgi:hypothetical protein
MFFRPLLDKGAARLELCWKTPNQPSINQRKLIAYVLTLPADLSTRFALRGC